MPTADLLSPLETITRKAGKMAAEARTHLVRELKPDGSIVTNGDREVETYLRKALVELVPGTTVWGEEFGFSEPGPEGLWLVDPVDGTSNYAYGSPIWGVSIALAQGPKIAASAVFLPDLQEMYLADNRSQPTLNGQTLKPLQPGQILHQELLGYCESVLEEIGKDNIPGKMRCTGSFVYDGTSVASGRFRGLIGHREKLYDVAACVLICQQLGAEIRYVDGRPFDVAELSHNISIPGPWIIFPTDSNFHPKS